jgi:hypothetical protein
LGKTRRWEEMMQRQRKRQRQGIHELEHERDGREKVVQKRDGDVLFKPIEREGKEEESIGHFGANGVLPRPLLACVPKVVKTAALLIPIL